VPIYDAAAGAPRTFRVPEPCTVLYRDEWVASNTDLLELAIIPTLANVNQAGLTSG